MRLKGYIIRLGLFGLTKSDFRHIGRTAMTSVGWLWHRKFKGLHFQPFAGAKYGYARRSPSYNRAEQAWGKKRAPGPTRPLVFTGESERLAMSSNTVRSKATSFEKYHADVIVNAPALNRRNKNTAIDMRREVTTVIPSETTAMNSEFARVFVKETEAVISRKRGTKRLAG
jgi:hypothetical protein